MEFDELRRRALAGDKKAVDDLKKLENELKKKAAAGDQDAIRKLKILDDDRFYALRLKAIAEDPYFLYAERYTNLKFSYI